MGNIFDKEGKKLYEQFNKNDHICKLCSENIKKEDLVLCLGCYTSLHIICENKNNENKNYTECPTCKSIGSLGIMYKNIKTS